MNIVNVQIHLTEILFGYLKILLFLIAKHYNTKHYKQYLKTLFRILLFIVDF